MGSLGVVWCWPFGAGEARSRAGAAGFVCESRIMRGLGFRVMEIIAHTLLCMH